MKMCTAVGLGVVVWLLSWDTGHASDYFCKFDEDNPAITCIDAGSTSSVFNSQIDVSKNFLEFLINESTQFYAVPANKEVLRKQLEGFRRQLESTRKQAEAMREANPDKLDLYRQILATYSLGISMYQTCMSQYVKSSDGIGL